MSVYLHIGLHKTGTTYLQHHVFPKIDNVIFCNGYIRVKDLLSKRVKTVLISNEGMSGIPYKRNNYFEQFKVLIHHLTDIYNKPKFIVCFREPSSFIQSIYKQYLQEGGTMTFEEFFSLGNESFLNPIDFLFRKYVDFLLEMLGENNLFIYDFETFVNNKKKVISSIRYFLGDKLNPVEEQIQKVKSKSNPSVPLQLENFLIKLNQLNFWLYSRFSVRTSISLFGKTLNQRVLCQYILPRIIRFSKANRDLSLIFNYYKEDYSICLKEIKKTNVLLYQ